MHSVTINLQLADDVDPPSALITAQIDQQPTHTNDAVAATDWLAVLDAASTATRVDLLAQALPAIAQATEALRDRIAREQAAQEARQAALDEWTSATTPARTPPAAKQPPAAEPVKAEPAKPPVAEPAKPPVAEPAKPPVAEPAKAPVAEPAKAPVAEPAKAEPATQRRAR